MPYYNNQNEEEQEYQTPQPVQQAGNMAKKQGKKAIKAGAKKAGKAIAKAVSNALMWFVKFVIIPLLPYILAFLGIVLLVYFAWDIIFNSRGKTQDYQTEDTQEYNSVEKNESTGEIVATDLSFGNKIVKAFYTYFSEKSIYVVCPDEGVDEPIQYNSKEFITKFGENGEDKDFKDKYGREKMFYISPNALWSLDEFLNKGQFRFPEQFVKPVYNEGKEGGYALKQLTDDNGKLVAQSVKYSQTADKNFEVPKEGETETGVWDYGFGSILNYKKYTEEAKKVGSYDKIQVWNVKEQKIDYVTLEEAKKGSESGKYEGYKDYIDKSYEAEMPEANKTSYMIDKVTSPAGTISNEIEQRWEDSGEPFDTSITRTEKVTVKYTETKTEKVFLKCNESKTVNTYVDLDGKGSKPKTVKNECKDEDHTKHAGKWVTYEVTYEKTRPEEKELTVHVSGTIYRNIPRYVGNPDTSQITGSQYYRDYIRNYTTYVPESVLTEFNFKSIRARTGKDEEDLLKLLEREPFGGSSSTSGSVDLSNFELGSGASSDSIKKSMQYWDIIQEESAKFGVDPYVVLMMIAQESSGNPSCANGATGGYGLMQCERSVFFNKPQTIKYLDGTTKTFTPSYQSLNPNTEEGIRNQIMFGCNELRNSLRGAYWNPITALCMYNLGQFGTEFVVVKYVHEKYGIPMVNNYLENQSQEMKNKVKEVLTNGDMGWLEYRQWYKDTGSKLLGVPGGTPENVEYYLRYYISVDGQMPWAINDEGTKISADGSMTTGVGTGTSTGNANGSFSSWITNIWGNIKDGWKKLFPDLPEELDKERTEFEHKVPENQIDTIIKMMFVMEEQKYLTDYDDFTDEEWKEKFSLLFSNPIGTNWSGSSSNATVDVNQYFPNGFDLPLDTSPLTIKKEYSTSHMGVDIVSPKGTSVIAVADGEVTEVGNSSSKGGKYIRIKHEGGVYTLYGNLDTTSVKKGDKVTRGKSIGTTGSGSEGNVLHFELAKGESNEDPTWMITGFFNASDYNMTEEDAQIINQVIALAKTKIGCRYTQEANYRNGPNSFDCSGFVRWLYMQTTGVSIGTWTGEQEQVLKNYAVPMTEIQPGDVIFGPGHVTLYIGNGRIIHASNPKPYPQGGVKESNLYSKLNRAYRPIAYIRAQQGKTN